MKEMVGVLTPDGEILSKEVVREAGGHRGSKSDPKDSQQRATCCGPVK